MTPRPSSKRGRLWLNRVSTELGEGHFGGILQDHMDLWKGSGLLSALNLLKTLTWPTTIPTYSLQSNLLGNFTLDFSAWSGMLTAIRSIIIAIAGFVAYRMIFVGAR